MVPKVAQEASSLIHYYPPLDEHRYHRSVPTKRSSTFRSSLRHVFLKKRPSGFANFPSHGHGCLSFGAIKRVFGLRVPDPR